MSLTMADRVAPEKRNFSAPFSAVFHSGADKEKSMAFVPYKEQIKNPKWQRKRLEVLNERGWKCELCESNDEQLHVHHKHYKKGAMIWEYDNSELVVLCKNCHEETHDQKRLMDELIGSLDQYEFESLFSLLAGFFPSKISDEYMEQCYSAHDMEAGTVANHCRTLSVQSMRGLGIALLEDTNQLEDYGQKWFWEKYIKAKNEQSKEH